MSTVLPFPVARCAALFATDDQPVGEGPREEQIGALGGWRVADWYVRYIAAWRIGAFAPALRDRVRSECPSVVDRESAVRAAQALAVVQGAVPAFRLAGEEDRPVWRSLFWRGLSAHLRRTTGLPEAAVAELQRRLGECRDALATLDHLRERAVDMALTGLALTYGPWLEHVAQEHAPGGDLHRLGEVVAPDEVPVWFENALLFVDGPTARLVIETWPRVPELGLGDGGAAPWLTDVILSSGGSGRVSAPSALPPSETATARGPFFGPVLLVPASPGIWDGPVWLQDPVKRDRGYGLHFDSLGAVRAAYPALWIVRPEGEGILLDRLAPGADS